MKTFIKQTAVIIAYAVLATAIAMTLFIIGTTIVKSLISLYGYISVLYGTTMAIGAMGSIGVGTVSLIHDSINTILNTKKGVK